MSTPHPWVASALEELGELRERHQRRGLDPASAWRALVLRVRVKQAQATGLDVELPDALRALVDEVAPKAERPEGRGLLARLEETLSGGGDPFGELLDALLALDDAASVAEATGRPEEARELSRLAGGFVSLEPRRVGALGGFAERRLDTLAEQASVRELWEPVASAAADAAVEALAPAVPGGISLAGRRLMRRLRAARGASSVRAEVTEAPALRPLYARAAAGPEAPTSSFASGAMELYEDDGQLYVFAELPPDVEPTSELILHVHAAERAARLSFPVKERSKRGVIAQLGTVEELREKLRAAGFTPVDRAPRMVLELPVSGTSDDGR